MSEKLSIGQSSLCESRRHNSVIVESIVIQIYIPRVFHPHPALARMEGFRVRRMNFIVPVGSVVKDCDQEFHPG